MGAKRTVRSIEGLRTAREILRQPALSRFILAERMPGPGAATDETLAGYAHRMRRPATIPATPAGCSGEGELASVVAPDLRVRDIEGLRVCDSAVMPRVPSCNTDAPTVMVAEKAAGHIGGAPLLPPARLRAAAVPRGGATAAL